MPGLRVVLISRRFWPLIGGAETYLANFARALREQGHRVHILAARLDREWPEETDFDGLPISRLPHPSVKFWGTLRYMQAVARWLKRHRNEYDVVCVSTLKHDAYAALGAARWTGAPVVLRAERGGATGDCQWQQTANFGRRIRARCFSAAAVVAPSDLVAAELAETGYPLSRIHTISPGVPWDKHEGSNRRNEARCDAAEFDSQLRLGETAPLAIFAGWMDEDSGLMELVDGWSRVAQRFPNARLWLAGTGPLADRLNRRISEWGLPQRISLIGPFDDVSELLPAAHVLVRPSRRGDNYHSILEGMAAGLPCIAMDTPGNRSLITHEREGLLVGSGPGEGISEAICRIFANLEWGARMGFTAHHRVGECFTLSESVAHHVRLFECLLKAGRGERATGRPPALDSPERTS